MGDFDGKVVYITGVARGQGRKHAIRFAREGARIIGLDLCDSPSEYVKYRAATEDDLATTIERVEAEGGEILAEVGLTDQHIARQITGWVAALGSAVGDRVENSVD